MYILSNDELDHATPGGTPNVFTGAEAESLLQMASDIRALRARCDVLSVSMHKGTVHTPGLVNAYERQVAQAAIGAGADIVIGHHAHLLRGIEVYKGKPIFHGLGNFVTVTHALSPVGISDPHDWALRRLKMFGFVPDPDTPEYPFHPESRQTMLAKLTVQADGSARASYVPCFINRESQPIAVGHDEQGQRFDYVERISLAKPALTRSSRGTAMTSPSANRRASNGQARVPRIDLIRDAARHHFAPHGCDGASMRDIAADAGITIATLYFHCGTKDQLLFDVLEERIQQLLKGSEAAVADAGEQWSERLAAAIRFHVDFVAGGDEGATISTSELRGLNGALRDRHLATRDAYEQHLRGLVSGGIDAGEFRDVDVPVVVAGIIGMCLTVARWYHPGGRLSPSEIGDEYVSFVLRALSPTKRARGHEPAARRRARCRPDARLFGTLLHAAAAAPRRRRGQSRAARHG